MKFQLNLLKNPFDRHIILHEALVIDAQYPPVKKYLKDTILPAEKVKLPAEFLVLGVKYGISGGVPGRTLTSPLYSEKQLLDSGDIEIFEYSHEVPATVARNFKMPLLSAIEFFRGAKYELSICSYLICWKGGDFYLIKLNAFYTNWIKDTISEIEYHFIILAVDAHQLDEKDINGAYKWEFDFKAKQPLESTLQEAVKSDIYLSYIHSFIHG